eukprot:TRINITY_DN3169_c0_g1_i2.p1 TRINITY_DN3169_c0_g1~~TRINITY_DN3169_c0_g1_i2.p1  ORF type:complete len:310 (+),score=62.97 TRINITY_DN3169_c0_g1_i2:33-932(+)
MPGSGPFGGAGLGTFLLLAPVILGQVAVSAVKEKYDEARMKSGPKRQRFKDGMSRMFDSVKQHFAHKASGADAATSLDLLKLAMVEVSHNNLKAAFEHVEQSIKLDAKVFSVYFRGAVNQATHKFADAAHDFGYALNNFDALHTELTTATADPAVAALIPQLSKASLLNSRGYARLCLGATDNDKLMLESAIIDFNHALEAAAAGSAEQRCITVNRIMAKERLMQHYPVEKRSNHYLELIKELEQMLEADRDADTLALLANIKLLNALVVWKIQTQVDLVSVMWLYSNVVGCIVWLSQC